jgi:hypothetical protein
MVFSDLQVGLEKPGRTHNNFFRPGSPTVTSRSDANRKTDLAGGIRPDRWKKTRVTHGYQVGSPDRWKNQPDLT